MPSWNIAPTHSEDLVEQLLAVRDIDVASRDVFLRPDWDRDTHHHSEFQQMSQAVACVFEALEAGQKITVHGDYDADGTCGSAVLYETLTEIAQKMDWTPTIEVFLPDREEDGYGVALHTIERLAQEGTNVLVTVDCGIANAATLNRAHELGMRVVICDHHQLAPELPEYAFIIHPLAPGETYPNKSLCGTGVAFKFAWALFDEARDRGGDIPPGREKWLMDLVGIATVTDVMPLVGENRALELFGLKTLNQTRRPGLLQLIAQSRSELGSIDTQTIGFRIGPRINAAGRVASAHEAFRALTAPSKEEATELVARLEELNQRRRQLTDGSYKEAKVQAKENGDAYVQVVWSETWAPGIVGLVAGKLANEFGRPAFALTRAGDQYVGSGRTAAGLHLVEAMRACGDIFVKAGGHPQACGLTISTEDLVKTFQERVNVHAAEVFGDTLPEPELNIDAELSLADADWQTFDLLKQLEPFGQGNPEPVFVSNRLQVISARAVGSTGSHLKLTVNPVGGRVWKLIGFGFGSWADKLNMGDAIDIVYKLRVNEWNGSRELEGEIVDLRYTTDV